MEDAYQHSTELSGMCLPWTHSHLVRSLMKFLEEYDLPLELKYDNSRQFFIRILASELEQCPLPPVFTNVFRKKNMVECQTLELMKRNQKVHCADVYVILRAH
jgi:DNA mismatch repair protein MSH4